MLKAGDGVMQGRGERTVHEVTSGKSKDQPPGQAHSASSRAERRLPSEKSYPCIYRDMPRSLVRSRSRLSLVTPASFQPRPNRLPIYRKGYSDHAKITVGHRVVDNIASPNYENIELQSTQSTLPPPVTSDTYLP